MIRRHVLKSLVALVGIPFVRDAPSPSLPAIELGPGGCKFEWLRIPGSISYSSYSGLTAAEQFEYIKRIATHRVCVHVGKFRIRGRVPASGIPHLSGMFPVRDGFIRESISVDPDPSDPAYPYVYRVVDSRPLKSSAAYASFTTAPLPESSP